MMLSRLHIASLLLLLALPIRAQVWTRVVDLRGQWKCELGDDLRYAEPKLKNEKEWSDIFVPSPWENEGFSGYDGYAWYRRHVTIPSEFASRPLYLHLGTVDDVDEVYINGRMIGFSGSFPPHYITAYADDRVYRIPNDLIEFGGDNVIAVRVYDQYGEGGIVSGTPGIFERVDFLQPTLNLEGSWRFRLGEDWGWKNPGYDDRRWTVVTVPAFWETQGFRDFDGVAWYRREVRIPASLAQSELVFLAGRIDDVDEVYINGRRIGGTGTFGVYNQRETHRDLRAYTVPAGLLRPDADNVIAIRVEDRFMHGGITDGPIGFVPRDRWDRFRHRYPDPRENRENGLKDMLKRIFGN